jgi:hypothetical protein
LESQFNAARSASQNLLARTALRIYVSLVESACTR